MFADEKTILAAYQDAATKEVKLSKLEQQKRELDAKILKARQDLVKAKDKLHAIHLGISDIITPYDDAPELVTRLV